MCNVAVRQIRWAFGPVFDLGPVTLATIREAVRHYVETSPNAHLGHLTPREDLRDAFNTIRRRVGNHRETPRQAAQALARIAESMEDM